MQRAMKGSKETGELLSTTEAGKRKTRNFSQRSLIWK
jgi:hypothetical protein